MRNKFAERSVDYRRAYFRNNPPHMFGRYYCAYCGKLLSRKNVTIDHLYPVNAAQKSWLLRRRLKRRGYSDINDPKNLVAACAKCNSKKGKNLGKWIIRGRIGRYPLVWNAIHVIRIILIVLFTYICWDADGRILATKYFLEIYSIIHNVATVASTRFLSPY